MHRDDLVSQVRTRARLHGRNQAWRVIEAVWQAARPLVPAAEFQKIAEQLPHGVTAPASGVEPGVERDASRSLIRSVARALHVDEPNAAFLSRVVFEQLNAFCRGVTPAMIAPALPAEIRPLFAARADDPAYRYRSVFPGWSATAAALSLQAAPTSTSAAQGDLSSATVARSPRARDRAAT